MKESGFWRKLRPLMREAAPGIVVERIESWSTPGFPDVSGTWKGRDFWLELKIIRSGKVKFQPGQVPWLKRRWRAGSRCFVLAYSGDNSMLLFPGYRAQELSRKKVYDVTSWGAFQFRVQNGHSSGLWGMQILIEVVCGSEV